MFTSEGPDNLPYHAMATLTISGIKSFYFFQVIFRQVNFRWNYFFSL